MSDGKSAVSSAITSMGVSTAADASYEDMRNNILKIKPTIDGSWLKNQYTADAYINGKNGTSIATSIPVMKDYMLYNGTCGFNSYATPENNLFNNNNNKSSNDKYFWVGLGNTKWQNVCLSSANNYILVPSDRFGDASASDILSGKTATTKEGLKISGTMPYKEAIIKYLNCSEVYTIQAGYHDGSSKVIANNLKSQTNDASIMLEQIMPYSCFAYSRGKKITGNVSTTYLAEAYYWVPAKPNYGWQNINKNGTAFFFKQDHSHKLSTNSNCSKWASPYEVTRPLQDIFTLDTGYDILANTDDNNIFYIKWYNIINLAPGGAIYLYSPNWAIGKNRAVYIHSKWFTKDNPSADYYYISSTLSSILVATSVSKYFHIFNDRECTSNVSLGIQFNSETGVLYIGNESDVQIWTMNDIWIESVD
ncbi:hypothetical protein [uncultured Clostridium sp.]|uniref:hypothetical protein n=1 Tax=uncultured Clostridium sp. TaxID=59620 RepID=UPI00263AB8B0|nr:hypothetical protein [uncultured Clostridium sp.]